MHEKFRMYRLYKLRKDVIIIITASAIENIFGDIASSLQHLYNKKATIIIIMLAECIISDFFVCHEGQKEIFINPLTNYSELCILKWLVNNVHQRGGGE